jgi:hypothetical protein
MKNHHDQFDIIPYTGSTVTIPTVCQWIDKMLQSPLTNRNNPNDQDLNKKH